MGDRLLVRLFWLAVAAALLILLWRGGTYLAAWTSGRPDAVPRLVTPRGDLAGDEQTTIELFERSRDSVVFITTRAQVVDVWTRNVFSVPRGTGSGFIWDDAGHVITNFHVVENASEATVKLADGRSFQATLVGASPAHDMNAVGIAR